MYGELKYPFTVKLLLRVLIMACRDVWNILHDGLRSPQNAMAKHVH